MWSEVEGLWVRGQKEFRPSPTHTHTHSCMAPTANETFGFHTGCSLQEDPSGVLRWWWGPQWRRKLLTPHLWPPAYNHIWPCCPLAGSQARFNCRLGDMAKGAERRNGLARERKDEKTPPYLQWQGTAPAGLGGAKMAIPLDPLGPFGPWFSWLKSHQISPGALQQMCTIFRLVPASPTHPWKKTPK